MTTTDSPTPVWREHLGVLLTLGVPTLIAVRLIGVAHGNLQTAWAILQEIDTGKLAVAIVLQAAAIGVPIFVPVGLATVWLANTPRLVRPDHDQAKATLNTAAGIGASLVLATTISRAAAILFVVLVLVMALLVAWITWTERRTAPLRDRPAPKTVLFRAGLFVVGFVLTSLFGIGLTVSPIWLPAERIVDDHGKAFTAYVLSETEEELVILSADTGLVTYIQATGVERSICQPEIDRLLAPIRLGGSRPEYDKCPD